MTSSRRLVLSDDAAIDLRDIRRYTGRQWGARQRDRYMAQLRASLRSLLDFPERGRMRNELYPGCRSLIVAQHIVFYYLKEEEVVIDRILHTNQDVMGEFGP